MLAENRRLCSAKGRRRWSGRLVAGGGGQFDGCGAARGRALVQPGVSFWCGLQASPEPGAVGLRCGCRLRPQRQGIIGPGGGSGASQYGVRQVSSRAWMKRRSPGGKSRARGPSRRGRRCRGRCRAAGARRSWPRPRVTSTSRAAASVCPVPGSESSGSPGSGTRRAR